MNYSLKNTTHQRKKKKLNSTMSKIKKNGYNLKQQTKSESIKAGLHVNNQHRTPYDFSALMKELPPLKPYVITNIKGELSIDFSNAEAVKMLNKALLAFHYNIKQWDIPEGYLCPPIPGRADYIHRIAELLTQDYPASVSRTSIHHNITALDVGIGANCIYPIIAVTEYGWHCVGSDVDPISIKTAENIVKNNAILKGKITCRLQRNAKQIFNNIIQAGERYNVTLCNPPFHRSLEEAQQGTVRKLTNLSRNRIKKGSHSGATNNKRCDHLQLDANQVSYAKSSSPQLNFGGQKAELWCPGGEAAFIQKMALESKQYADQVLWFTTLISKKENLSWMKKQLVKVGADSVQVVEMKQGHKTSRFIAWSFKNAEQRQIWIQENKAD